MNQRLSQAKLQRFHKALQELIASIWVARSYYRGCSIRVGRLAGTSRFVRDLTALPHTTDYSIFEVQLKRRLVRARHRVFGIHTDDGLTDKRFALVEQLPFGGTAYDTQIRNFDIASRELLRVLGDVNISENHQQQKSVQELML